MGAASTLLHPRVITGLHDNMHPQQFLSLLFPGGQHISAHAQALLYPAFQNSSSTKAAKAGSVLCSDPDTISFFFRVSKHVCDLAA